MRRTVFFITSSVLLLFVLFMPSPAVKADGPTATPQAKQITVMLQPSSGYQAYPQLDKDVINFPTVGGGDVQLVPGGKCLSGYSSERSSFGAIVVQNNGSGSIQVKVVTQTVIKLGLTMWSIHDQQFWCTSQFIENPALQFDNLSDGIYYFWLYTEQPQEANSLAAEVTYSVIPTK